MSHVTKMENSYFHPTSTLKGLKITDKVRAKIYEHEGSTSKMKQKRGYKHWDKWENGYFQPLGAIPNP